MHEFLRKVLESIQRKQYHDSNALDVQDLENEFNVRVNEQEDNAIKIKPIPVIMVNPDPDYVLKRGDILYGFGQVRK